MKRKIAGHEWLDDKIDSPCILMKNSETACNMTRSVLFGVTSDDINLTGFAHTATLTHSEYSEICIERDEYKAHCDRIMDALRHVCG